MSEESPRSADSNRKRSGDQPAGLDSAISALSRVFAILVLLMAVGGVGAVGDWLLGTSFLMPIGFALGTLLAVVGMFYVVKIAEIEAKNNRSRGSTLEETRNREESSRGGKHRILGWILR